MADGDNPETNGKTTAPNSWEFDVQRGLAWTIVLVFAAVIVAAMARVMISADVTDVNDTLKSALAVLFNIVMLVLGYFFGSSKSSQSKDETQNKIVEKLTSTQPAGPPGPVAPVPPVVVVAWWSLLTEEEKAAITAAAPTDPSAAEFLTALQSGKATTEGLANAVKKGWITQARADVINAV